MKRFYSFLFIFAAITSCQVELLKQDAVNTDGDIENVQIIADDFVYSGLTKTSIAQNLTFTWADKDTVGIFPNVGAQIPFPIVNGDGVQTSKANFTGGGWAVKGQSTYMAYYPFIGEMYMEKESIKVNYKNQKQKENKSTEHLSDYDYMAAAAESASQGSISFHFKHLSALCRFRLNVPKSGNYTSLEISCPTNDFIISGTVDLTAQTPSITPKEYSSRIKIDLDNIVLDQDGDEIQVWFMIPPVNMTGHKIKIKIKGDNADFDTIVDGRDFISGGAYDINPETAVGGETVQLVDGDAFNTMIKKLAHPAESDFPSDHSEYDIKSIIFVANDSSVKSGVDVSSSSSPEHIWANYDKATGCVTITSPASKVYAGENAGNMFRKMEGLKSIDFTYFDVSNTTSMGSMFYGCRSLTSLDLGSFDTYNVSDMGYMFYDCVSLTTLNIASFRTPNLERPMAMFMNCSALTSLDLSKMDFRNVKYISDMFRGCTKLESIDLSSFTLKNDFSDAPENEKGIDAFCAFMGCASLKNLDLSNLTAPLRRAENMFEGCESLTSLDVSMLDTRYCTTYAGLFANCKKLTSIDVSGLNTEKLTDMGGMFYNCHALSSITWGQDFSTAKVTRMSGLFEGCHALSNIDLSIFNTSSVTDMSNMFAECSSLTSLDLTRFITNNVTNMGGMFKHSTALKEVDLSSFVGANLGNISEMFFGCTSLEEVDLSSIIAPKLGSMAFVFRDCSNLRTVNFGKSFDTHFVESMEGLFLDCTSLESVDMTMFDTGYLKSVNSLIDNCPSLRELDLSSFDTRNCTSTVYNLVNWACSLNRIVLGDAFDFGGNRLDWGLTSDATIVCNRAQKDHLIRTQSFNYSTPCHLNWINSETGTSFAPVDETLFQRMLNKGVTVLHV